MKKTFLILFAFISVLALSQVPQRFNKVIVTGDITSPKFIKTGSNADSVLLGNGSARAISTIKIDTTSLSNRINTKQEILISGTNIRTVNGNSVLGSGDIQISSGGGGSPTNNYLSNVNSTVSGYKEARPDIDVAETVKTITVTSANAITWGEKYLYTSPVSTTIIPSGFWELHAYGNISTATGISKLVFRVLRYSGSTETILATFTGFEVNNTTDAEMLVNGSTNDITVLAGDYLGIQVGFLSDGTSPARTLTYTIGDGNASHFNTPLPTRHSALRDKNGEVDFQHLTAAQVTKVNNTSETNTGDETLTSIKTKLGAATSVSDGYLKYQDYVKFDGKQNSLTIGNLTSTTSGVTIGNGTGAVIGSGATVNIATAGTSSDGILTSGHFNTFNNKEPAITKNTGFNLPIGSTTGTVLEGRTFGTAAGSSVGDFQPIENQRLSTSNSPSFNTIASTVATGTAPLTVNSTTLVDNLNSKYLNGFTHNGGLSAQRFSGDFNSLGLATTSGLYSIGGVLTNQPVGESYGALLATWNGDISTQLYMSYNGNMYWRKSIDSTYTGSVWRTIYDSGNLTNNLSTNYIPKWNGSNFVNGVNSDDIAIVYQTQTTVNGSTSGNMVCSMPIRTGTCKKVMLICNALLGNAEYTYPVGFTANPFVTTSISISHTIATGGCVISPSSPYTGIIIIEGY